MRFFSTIAGLLFLVSTIVIFQNCSASSTQTGNVEAQPEVETNIQILPEVRENLQLFAEFPHKVDLLYPTSMDSNTKAIVMLHGGGGIKTDYAYFLGFKTNRSGSYSNSNAYLKSYLNSNNIALVFVEGQSIAEQPNVFGWSNYIMTSGQDDKTFLEQLSSYLRQQEGFNKVYVMGHSMGGAMVNRLWCESPGYFDGFGSSAGPMAADLWDNCNPTTYQPYIHVTGLNDRIIQIVEDKAIGPDIDRSSDVFLNLDSLTRTSGGIAFIHSPPEFKNELTSYPDRVNNMCGETEAAETFYPSADDWTSIEQVNCSGRLKMIQLRDVDHCTAKNGDYKCDIPMTTFGTTDHLDRFVEFFKAN